MPCDCEEREITIEVVKTKDTIAVANFTLHQSVSKSELDLIFAFSIECVKRFNSPGMVRINFPCDESPVYRLCVISTWQ